MNYVRLSWYQTSDSNIWYEIYVLLNLQFDLVVGERSQKQTFTICAFQIASPNRIMEEAPVLFLATIPIFVSSIATVAALAFATFWFNGGITLDSTIRKVKTPLTVKSSTNR